MLNECQLNDEFIINYVTTIEDGIKNIPLQLINAKIINSAIQKFPSCIQYIPKWYITHDLCNYVIEQDIENTQYIPEEFCNTKLLLQNIKLLELFLEKIPDGINYLTFEDEIFSKNIKELLDKYKQNIVDNKSIISVSKINKYIDNNNCDKCNYDKLLKIINLFQYKKYQECVKKNDSDDSDCNVINSAVHFDALYEIFDVKLKVLLEKCTKKRQIQIIEIIPFVVDLYEKTIEELFCNLDSYDKRKLLKTINSIKYIKYKDLHDFVYISDIIDKGKHKLIQQIIEDHELTKNIFDQYFNDNIPSWDDLFLVFLFCRDRDIQDICVKYNICDLLHFDIDILKNKILKNVRIYYNNSACLTFINDYCSYVYHITRNFDKMDIYKLFINVYEEIITVPVELNNYVISEFCINICNFT